MINFTVATMTKNITMINGKHRGITRKTLIVVTAILFLHVILAVIKLIIEAMINFTTHQIVC
jgi:hypothetical protein